jgi:hypothetical protein
MMPEPDEWAEFQRKATLNALIDAFCSHYGVTDHYRARGSRIKYISWHERIGRYFSDWRSTSRFADILRGTPPIVLRRIEEAARDPRLWDASGANNKVTIPVDGEEYASGFGLAACLVAASECPLDRRGHWAEPLQTTPPADWLKHSDVPAVEDALRSQAARLLSIGNSINVAADHRNLPATWTDFCESVWNRISNGSR